MRYGLIPTQREEWKNNHKVRFFFEERVVELQDVALYFLANANNAMDFLGRKNDEYSDYIMNNKIAVIKTLITVFIIAMIMV